MIRIQHVSKTFLSGRGEVHALQDVTLHVERGDIFGVIGFSGAGKSTLIRTVNLLERPDAGEVLVEGENVCALTPKELRRVRKKIGMIFQQFNLLSSKTVFQNVAAPLLLNKVSKEETHRRVEELLRFVGLEDKIHVNAGRLSGGQKQRVGIARALATNPSILLCDEATSALDPKTTASILALLKRINRELGVTILLITHEMNVIRDVCNKVAVLDGGRLIEQGEVIDVFGDPRHTVTRSFVRMVMNDSIPPSIIAAIRKDGRQSAILKLRFDGESANVPLLSDISRRFEVENSILYASVHELQGKVLSVLIVRLFGDEEKIRDIEAYSRQAGVSVERLSLELREENGEETEHV